MMKILKKLNKKIGRIKNVNNKNKTAQTISISKFYPFQD